jgi:hypothetical protein
MKYYFGLDLNDDKNYLINNCINLNYFYKLHKNNVSKNIITYNNFIKLEEVKKILEGELSSMYDSLFQQFANNEYIENYNFNKIIHFMSIIYSAFRAQNKVNIPDLPGLVSDHIAVKIYNLNDSFENKLLIRTGVVELRAINSYLYGDKQLITKALENICVNYRDEDYIYKQPFPHWITLAHTQIAYESYLKTSMTAAGFYFDESNVDDALENLDFFSNGYKEAILNSDYLMHWNFLNCYSLDILNEKKQKKKIEYFLYDENSKIYDLLNNKKILLITPFKEKIDKIYKNGNIYKLRKNRNLENIDLVTIEAFLTTYPNKKHNNFKQTFEYYCKMIDKEFENENFDIFTCAAGAYGLLLCNYVHKKYNITSLYMGHIINYIFGIRGESNNITGRTEYYEKSDLNDRYKNIEKIEGNRYGSS